MVVRFYRVISSMVTLVMKRRLITWPAVSLDSREITPPSLTGTLLEGLPPNPAITQNILSVLHGPYYALIYVRSDSFASVVSR